nr:hypothetical protein [Tanacetum cinerariifolium]
MAKLAFCDYHNMVAILEKTEPNTDFHQIVDFLEASHIRYAWTIRPIFYVSHIRQFWSTTKVETTDGETKILAQVNDRQRTISESSIRRHLKLNDEEGISTLPGNELFENLSLMGYNILSSQRTVELFASMLVPRGEGSEHPSKPHHTPSDQDEPIHHKPITQPPQHAQITSHEPIPQSHEQTTSQEQTIPSQSHSVITTPRRITRGSIWISQSKVPLLGADETAFPTGDVRYGEAFPTDSSLDAGQDRENIAKTSAMPHKALPRVTSLVGGEGNKDLLRRMLQTRGVDQGEDLLDIEKSADKGSDSTDEMSHVLGSLGAANILASGGLRLVFTTASLSVATANTDISFVVATASGSFPTAAILPLPVKKDKGKGKMTEPEQPSKEKRDSEIARIHPEKELEMMIAEIDRSNEMVAKYSSEYEQAEAELLHDEKVEFIDELLMYHRNLTQIKKYQAQQNKPATKTERRNFYMSILRSNAGTEPTQEQQSEEPKELSEEELKKMMELVPVEELYIEALQVTDEKAKELWVELKRLYEPDSKDPPWALQRYMHDPLVWRLYDTCGVHHISTGRGHQIFMLMEKDYPLTKGLTTLMLSNKL